MRADHDPIRVLWVSDHLGFSDGVVHGAAQLYRNVLPRFFDSTVSASLCILREEHPFKEEMEKVGITPVFFARKKWDPRVLLDLIRQIRRNRIQIVHLHGQKAMIFGRIAAIVTGCRIVVHIHDTNFPHGAIGTVQRLFSRWTTLAIGVSDIVSEGIKTYYGVPAERVITIPNAIPLEEYATRSEGARTKIRDEFAIHHGARVITTVGRFSPQKGHAHLIKAMPEVLTHRPDTILLIVGDGPLRQDYEDLIAELGLQQSVRLTGQRRDIPDILAASDLFIMPSLAGEGLPLACLEAFAAGLPVVAYRSQGVDEVIDQNETGILVEPSKIQDLGTAIHTLLNNEPLLYTLSSNCKLKSKKWDINQYAENTSLIYKNLMSRKNKS